VRKNRPHVRKKHCAKIINKLLKAQHIRKFFFAHLIIIEIVDQSFARAEN
jgi:hypothetical protein